MFNFSSSVVKTTSVVQASPPPAIAPPPLQVSPSSASQPGSQEEQIWALQGLDDPAASQEQKAEELEEGERTPEKFTADDTKLIDLITPGSESSSKKRGKRGISKKKKGTSASDEKVEGDPIAPLSPSPPTHSDRLKKLTIRPGEGSKGGGKKK